MAYSNVVQQQYTQYGQQGPQGPQQQGGYSQQSYSQTSYNRGPNQGPPPPQPPAPWSAQWDNQQNKWSYVNRQTNERSYNFPSQGGSVGQGNRGFGGGVQQQNYQQTSYSQQGYGRPPPPQQVPQAVPKDHSKRNVALGAMAGLAGGALLMHEGDKVKEHWDEDKFRAEESYDVGRDRRDYGDRDIGFGGGDYVQDNTYIQDNTYVQDDGFGRDDYIQDDTYVQDDSYVRDDGYGGFNNGGGLVDDLAYGVGDAVGGVESWGDGIDNSFDAGRDETRFDDDYRDGW